MPVIERDHNGERGPVPYRDRNGAVWLYGWRRARQVREYLDALRAEMGLLDAR